MGESYQLLELCQGNLHFVLEHEVVAGACGALDGILRLQIKVAVVGRRDRTIDKSAREAIPVSLHGVRKIGREEPSVVSLRYDDGCDLDQVEFVLVQKH